MDKDFNIIQIIEKLELEGEVIGDEFVAYCKFHNERDHPNLEINIKSGLFHCWVCGEKGNVVSMVMRLQQVSYQDAILWLNDFGVEKDIHQIREDILRELRNIRARRKLYDFHEIDITPYLTEKPNKWWLKTGISEETIEELILCYSREMGRAVMPVRFDMKWVGYIARATRKTQIPRYMNSYGFPKEHILYGWDNLPTRTTSAIVVEGPRDKIRLHDYGFKNSLAVMGSHITATQQQLLIERFDEVTIWLDNDLSGHLNTFAMANVLQEYMPRVHIVTYLDDTKDPDQLTKEDVNIMYGDRAFWSSLILE